MALDYPSKPALLISGVYECRTDPPQLPERRLDLDDATIRANSPLLQAGGIDKPAAIVVGSDHSRASPPISPRTAMLGPGGVRREVPAPTRFSIRSGWLASNASPRWSATSPGRHDRHARGCACASGISVSMGAGEQARAHRQHLVVENVARIVQRHRATPWPAQKYAPGTACGMSAKSSLPILGRGEGDHIVAADDAAHATSATAWAGSS